LGVVLWTVDRQRRLAKSRNPRACERIAHHYEGTAITVGEIQEALDSKQGSAKACRV
jgi:hypothetical protein